MNNKNIQSFTTCFLPYGEPTAGSSRTPIKYTISEQTFVEQRSNWGTNYKFNGKELDEETGYYYYGARYYNPDISIWLSIDPLSDKYPSLSPYNYCTNNPIRYVDPDGRSFDEWGIDDKGNLWHLDFKRGPEELYRVDSKGNKISSNDGSSEYISFNKSDIQKVAMAKVDVFDSGAEKIGEKKYFSFEITNFETAERLFEFFADFGNVEASFTSMTNHKTNETLFLIRTTQSENTVNGENEFLNSYMDNGWTITRHVHNHPRGSNTPSGRNPDAKSGDIPFRNSIKQKSPNAEFLIYTKGKNYFDYTNYK